MKGKKNKIQQTNKMTTTKERFRANIMNVNKQKTKTKPTETLILKAKPKAKPKAKEKATPKPKEKLNEKLKPKEKLKEEDIVDEYTNMNLTELKAVLRRMNLKMTGKKPVLLKRIRRYLFLKRHKKSDRDSCVKNEKEWLIKDVQIFFYEEEFDFYTSKITVSKWYKYIIRDIATQKVCGKLNTQKQQIEELSRDDIFDLQMRNLEYEIPIQLQGDPIRKRNQQVIDDIEDIESYYELVD